jgi:trk system potassium uptake protein
MNYLLLIKYLGHFSIAASVLMLPSAAWSLYFREWGALGALMGSSLAALILGGLLSILGRRAANQMFHREALALVGLGWLMMASLGSLPFLFSGALGPVDALFESMSGFTTTGATVIGQLDSIPRSILFWRSFTHWLGGMGIIVLFVAVLPYLGAGGKQLFKSESPGPDPRGLKPRIKDTASILYKMYIGLTVAQTMLLMGAGLDFFEALCHTFGTLATGGFSTHDASIAAYDSVYVEIIIIAFMVVAGGNFALYFAMIRGDWRSLPKNTEWRIYIGILAVSTLLVTANLMGLHGQVGLEPLSAPDGSIMPDYRFGHALRAAAFQVTSIMTTTGYCTENFDRWPHFSRALLVGLMFFGGCAGSTGGGMKVIRWILLTKMAYHHLKGAFQPKTIQTVRLGGQIVEADVQRRLYTFFFLYIAIFLAGTIFMSFLGLPLQTAATSVIATLNNIGPGLEMVGAVENYAFIPIPGKLFLTLCMVMGRLELFSICVLFIPAFWRQD